MAFTPITVGEAKGLQAQVKDYTNQIIGAQKLRRQEDALKRKEEEEEFAKLADIKIDYSKYHRIDRPRVKQMYASYLNEMNKLYREGNPNWKNAAYEKGNDLKFAIEQVAVDSKVKFDTEKYVTDPTTKKSDELMAYYNWLNQGDFNNPPKIQPDAYGQITAFDPTTGTIGFVSGKNYNLPKLAAESVFDPALVGYVTDPSSVTPLTDGYKNITQRAEYNPVMIEGAIDSLVGTEDFNGWRIENAERIRKYAAANPSLAPEDVMYNLWAEDIMNQEPTKTKEYRLSPRQSFNINMGGGEDSPYIYTDPKTILAPFSMGGKQETGDVTLVTGYTDDFNVNVTNSPEYFTGDGTKKMSKHGTTKINVTEVGVTPVFTKDLPDALKKTFGLTGYGDLKGTIIPSKFLSSPNFLKSYGEYKVYFFGSTIPEQKTGTQSTMTGTGGSKNEFIYGPAGNMMSGARFLGDAKWKVGVQQKSIKDLEERAKKMNQELNNSIGTAPKEEKKTAAKEINASLIPEKAKAAGYTEKEYRKLLEENGVKIIE